MYAHPLLDRTDMSSAALPLLQPNRQLASMSPRQKILVPTDGSAAEEAAIAYVIDLARTGPVAVHLLNVQPPVMAGDVTRFTTACMVAQQRRRAGEQALGRARGALGAARVAHTTEVALGSPAAEIVRSAATQACSKIVMATRNTGIMKLLLRRSVAQRVVALAPLPVTLVKPSSARAGAIRRRATGLLQASRLCAWRKRSCSTAATYHAV
jgi:nucleotide-binding universal stress UspA family protein